MKKFKAFCTGILVMLFVLPVCLTLTAQVSITSTATPYTQNFNTLRATAGTSTTLPAGWRLLETGTNANTSYASDAGATATGNTYSYGTGTSTERAFGTLLSGSLNSTIGVQIRNSTGQTITSMVISYTGEEWRCGTTGRADRLDFQYSLSATSLSTGTWTDVNTLDFSSPSTTTTGAKDGNAAANRTLKTATITGLNIASNGLFWLRWTDLDASGSDDGLAVDDFSIQLTGSDVTPPVVTLLSPGNNATGIAQNGNLVITFNETIQKGTAGNITLKRSSDGVIVNSTAVTDAAVTVSTTTATIPYSGLAYSTSYYVEMPAGTFKDAAGNNFAGITGTTTWLFSTLAQPAAAVTVSPASLDFGFTAAGNASPAQTFGFTTTNLTAALTLTAPASFELSKNGTTFTSSLNYTLAEAQAGQAVYARFVPATANTSYSGLVNFSSTGLNDNKESLSGNSIVTSSGPLNYYFGNLHAHSSYSDGNADDVTKTPADDYAFAKNSLCFDYLGLSEHNHIDAGMQLADWQPGRNQAAAATTSTFVGLYGMEWGTISTGGHVIIYGMDSLIGWDAGQHQVFVAKGSYTGTGGLFNIINRHGGNALAYLAHPATGDYNGLLNGAYNLDADNAIVGSAVESGPAFSTSTAYNDPGTSMSYLTYFKNMLAKGYHIGPAIDHDNHNMTFGRTAKTRLAILATSLTENNLLGALKQMRFYASQDCAAKINYTVNGAPMGSIITQSGVPVISLSSITTNPVTSVNVMYGVPGSGSAATVLTTGTSGTLTFTDNTLSDLSQRYYYLDITESDGTRIVTSPVWYTRNDAALFVRNTAVTSFFTVNEENRVVLKWTTAHEEEGQEFEIERSTDGGKTFTLTGTVKGYGAGNDMTAYGIADNAPYNGVAFYRLLQKSSNGNINYSDIKTVNRSGKAGNYFTVFPNPVLSVVNVKITAAAAQKTLLEVYDMTGRRMLVQNAFLQEGEQNIKLDLSRLQQGNYVLTFILSGKKVSQRISKF